MCVTVINVGYGDAILFQLKNGYTALLDGGSALESEFEGDSYRIRSADYLARQQIEHLNAVIISHIHEDHVCGLEAVLQQTVVDHLYVPYPVEPFLKGCELTPASNAPRSVPLYVAALNAYRRILLHAKEYPLGELTEDEKRFYTWTLQCHIDIAKAVWLNYCDGHMLDTIAREPLWRHLINYRCGTGHSVSFVGNVHEGPHALNGRNTTLMRPGMIVTDEPGVYEAGEVGIRIENEIECYHKADNQYGTFLAFRPLTFVPIATSPIVPGVLDKEQVAWLNDYHRKVFEQLAPRLTEDERAWLAEKCAAIGC